MNTRSKKLATLIAAERCRWACVNYCVLILSVVTLSLSVGYDAHGAIEGNEFYMSNEHGTLKASVKDGRALVEMKAGDLVIRSVTDHDKKNLIDIFVKPKNPSSA